MTGTGAYDEFIHTDGNELWDRIHEVHRRFAALLSVTPAKHPVPGSDWTAGQIAAHLLTIVRCHARRDLTALNDARLDELGPISVAEILDQVWQELADLEARFPRTADLHQRLPFHGGHEVDLAGWLGNLIGEFTVHGRDVARSRGKAWKIGSRNAALALNAGIQAFGGFASPDHRGDLKLAIRTPESNPWVLDVSDGEISSRRAVRRETVDVRVFARAEPLLLHDYGRIGVPTLTVLGAVVTGGRRPWRIARLPSAFLTP